ncbi:MAG: hypothetical protein IT350_02625 [Deltaproteobacteria bacterium]|nr:hypothetical protein [Deltaproteobacteria bacterium]
MRGIVRDTHDGWVFGIVDRDFGTDNFDRWANPPGDLTVYRLPVFEIENYLLDFELIADCRANYANRSEDEVRSRAIQCAEAMPAWLACRDVLARCRGEMIGEYFENPTFGTIPDLAAATTYIGSQPWLRDLELRAHEVVANLNPYLNVAHTLRRQQLENQIWNRDFPGKEIFRTVRGYVTQTAARAREGTSVQEDIDLARAIADSQRAANRIPSDLALLHDSLVRRVGLA